MKIFFSWQSEINENRKIIEPSLKDAVSEFNSLENPASVLENDSAMRNTPGAPDINITILEKIKNADFYICDVTPIVSDKDIANSNVMFELGFAVSHLGWERIILLFNTSLGNIESQLPFDIKTHNVKGFSTAGDAKNNIAALKQKILKTLQMIYKKDPPKILLSLPQRLLIRKTRDIENLKRVIRSAFCLRIWDDFFKDFPSSHFSDAITSFYFAFCELYESAHWHFYDTKLNEYFDEIHINMCYVMDKSDPLFCYSPPNGVVSKNIWSEEEHKAFRKCVDLMYSAQKAYTLLMKYIREEYIEVDVDALSDEAGRIYAREQKNLNEEMRF